MSHQLPSTAVEERGASSSGSVQTEDVPTDIQTREAEAILSSHAPSRWPVCFSLPFLRIERGEAFFRKQIAFGVDFYMGEHFSKNWVGFDFDWNGGVHLGVYSIGVISSGWLPVRPKRGEKMNEAVCREIDKRLAGVPLPEPAQRRAVKAMTSMFVDDAKDLEELQGLGESSCFDDIPSEPDSSDSEDGKEDPPPPPPRGSRSLSSDCRPTRLERQATTRLQRQATRIERQKSRMSPEEREQAEAFKAEGRVCGIFPKADHPFLFFNIEELWKFKCAHMKIQPFIGYGGNLGVGVGMTDRLGYRMVGGDCFLPGVGGAAFYVGRREGSMKIHVWMPYLLFEIRFFDEDVETIEDNPAVMHPMENPDMDATLAVNSTEADRQLTGVSIGEGGELEEEVPRRSESSSDSVWKGGGNNDRAKRGETGTWGGSTSILLPPSFDLECEDWKGLKKQDEQESDEE
uniref:Uncharacterized protein n=1 Tax=Chromera velia CCMP2878 TaxID=1169474 RepID=A0A0G4H4J1_9ALVE|eukprot:Cvel_5670.t1-p1 / transcript=Cvel_5670.t1 / gene=Cvel_5670 / organism=Chromera_velia_CCMP2878 / gene_product=hypothetical protein / transcript_product=hypothetical protein / location=Cvel_scaffold267:92393-94676(-) / protein_length=458 / sequence_SO=supercontig / SO=protein_coding / is_pseudo=false